VASKRRFIDDASAASLVRYGPELSALKQLMAEADSGYRQKVHSAQAGAAGVQSAVASAAGARRTAISERGADIAKIQGRRQDIAQEIGAFTSSEASKLADAAAQRDLQNRISLRSVSQQERNSLRSAGIDPNTGDPIPNGKLDPKTVSKKKLQTPDAHNTLRTQINDARDVALPLAKQFVKKKGPQTRNFVDALLRSGLDEPAARIPVYVTDPTTGTQHRKLNPDGTPVYQTKAAVKVPKVSGVARGAALDLIFDGHISAKHLRLLHKARFSVNQLGLPTRGNPQSPEVRLPRPRSSNASAPYSRPGSRVY
jgi:hypothetical protein